jgi:AcrR family transcriptional regulator
VTTDRRSPRRSKQQTEQAVFSAVLALLADGGLGALTIDALAAQAAISKSTFYEHWGSTNAVLLAVLTQTHPVAVIPDLGRLDAELRAFFVDRQQVYRRRGTRRLLSGVLEAAAADSDMRNKTQEFLSSQIAPVQAVLARAAARGELRTGVSTATMVTTIVSPIYYRAAVEGQPISDDFINELLSIWESLLGRGRGPQEGTGA